MSQPERYEPRARRIGGPWKMVKCKDGPYVCHEQHAEIVAALQAEVERLKAETVKQIEAALPPVEAYIAKLEAENERLRKAGEQVQLAWSHYENGLIETPEWVKRSQIRDAIGQLWLAAKGVQS